MTRFTLKSGCLFGIIFFYLLPGIGNTDTVTQIPEAQLKINTTSSAASSVSETRFTKSDIKKSASTQLASFLSQAQSVARLTNNSGDSHQTIVSLRGFGDNAVANSLILVDGFPLSNPSLLAPNLNAIALSDIERIEIIEGSQGSLYGDQAVGGVISITTRHPKHFLLNVTSSVGSFHAYTHTIFVGDRSRTAWFYKLWGSLNKTDLDRDHHLLKGNALALQIGKEYARGFTIFNVQSDGDTLYFPGGLSEQQFKDNPHQATEFKNNVRYRTTRFQLLNKHELNSRWQLETRLDHHQTDGDGFIYLHFDRTDSSTLFSPRLIGNLNRHQLILGYDGQISRYDFVNVRAHPQASSRQQAIYGQDTFAMNSAVDFILGARGVLQNNQVEAIENQPVSTINRVFVSEQGFRFHPSQDFSWFIRRDGNFRLPKANEQTWLPANVHSLKVQTGTSYEAGAKWESDAFISQVSIYRLILKNEIAFDPLQTQDVPIGVYRNFDPTLRDGISISEQYQLNSKAKLNSQLNYVKARFSAGSFSGNEIPAVPTITGNVGFHYDWTEHWATQYNLLYTGSRYASEDVDNAGGKIPGFWLNNMAMQYGFKAFTFSFEVNNIFNKSYVNYAFYDPRARDMTYYPATGRNYLFTVKVNLD